MTAPQAIRYDRAGAPVRKPPRFTGTYSEFADLVDQLTPTCCGYPAGDRQDSDGRPCTHPRLSDDGCEKHAAKNALKRNRTLRALPKRTQKIAAFHSVDTTLLEMRNDVALMAARREEIVARLSTGESTGNWQLLKKQWRQLNEAQRAVKEAREIGDELAEATAIDKSNETFKKIGETIGTGNKDEENWKEINSLTERLTALKGMEVRRQRESGQTIGADEMISIMQQVRDIVCDNVRDPEVQKQIALDLGAIFGVAVIRSSNHDPMPDAKPAELTVDHYLERRNSEPESEQSDAD